ncbi:MAG: hypothetical protein ACKVJW_06305, partial [Flavobacteriales bacterium]
MRKIVSLLISIFTIVNINAQIIISTDTNFCAPQVYDLYALSATPSTMFTDDLHDIVIPIGFDFDFYSNTYNKCVVSG